MNFRRLLFIILFIIISTFLNYSNAQSIVRGKPVSNIATQDTSEKRKPYSEIISASAITKKGLFTIHHMRDKIYLEIPAHLLNKDILIVSRIATGAEDGINLYAGDEIGNMVVRFGKNGEGKILVRKIQYGTYSGDTTSSMYSNVVRSNLSPIIASFLVEATAPDSSSLINITDLFLGDNDGFSLPARAKSLNGVSTLEKDKTYIDSIFSFPGNTEVHMVKTYGKAAPVTEESRNVTIEINSSLILLPDKLMKQRFKDERVGFFSITQANFDGVYPGLSGRYYIKRWRMEPKPEDADKYMQGVLVEPEKPIIFYIDPTTPKQWIPYIIMGINDWQIAFEKAGFKNAIYGRTIPSIEEDPTWSLYDARHSAIVYKPSPDPNASGPSIADPRTGEILESHINFYHNIMTLIHGWYMLQCGAVDAKARKMVFDDSLMGQLIRRVVCHEVGHTIGLTHNMASSSTVPVEKLRDKNWLKENGICPSIMDYARFNYVAQPEDSIGENELMSSIGVYDKWAIEWGYRWFPPFPTPKAESVYLNKWVSEKLTDHRLWYGPQNNKGDPRIQVENVGDDNIAASEYGLKNLKRIIPNLIEWTKVPNEGYWSLQSRFYMSLDQYWKYMIAVIDNIGGTEETLKTSDQEGGVYRPVSAQVQKESIAFINKHAFVTPLWIADTNILVRTGETKLGAIGRIQDWVLKSLINVNRFNSMVSRNESTFGERTYTLLQLLKDLEQYVWAGFHGRAKIDLFRRNLQKLYLVQMKEVYKRSSNNQMISLSGTNYQPLLYNQEVQSLVSGHLKNIQVKISGYLKLVDDDATKYHLTFIKNEINNVFKMN